MKFILRALGILVLAVIVFAIVSYALFGDDPEARLKLELDHDISVGGGALRTTSEIQGCDLRLTVNQLDGEENVVEGQKLSIPLKALAAATAEPGTGFIAFTLPERQTASCQGLDGTPCTNATRSEVQLNLPSVRDAEQAEKVLGWVRALAESCET